MKVVILFRMNFEQAGNGKSRRHISGSKIAKGHESVKKHKVSNSQKEYQTHEKPKRRNWRLSPIKVSQCRNN